MVTEDEPELAQAFELDEQSQAQQVKETKPRAARVHYIDWMRCVLVVAVVLAHTSVVGLSGGVNGGKIGGKPPKVQEDDRVYTEKDPSSPTVRWISLLRPLTLPMLFWISGASFALSFRGKICSRLGRSFLWIAIYTLCGFAGNAFVVFLGPKDHGCSPGDHDRDSCQGTLWNFQIWPWSDTWGAIQFQMWYTLFLMFLLLLNLPLLWVFFTEATEKRWVATLAGAEFSITMAFWILLLTLVGDDCKEPMKVSFCLAVYEFAFVAVAPMAITGLRERYIGKINVRIVHYVLGVIAWLQFSTTPFAEEIQTFSVVAIFYILVGFNKYFVLGFVMLRSRVGPVEEDAQPICSRVWPMMIAPLILTCPTSNWMEGGVLTYPFYPRVSDRMNFVANGVLVTFFLDRIGRHFEDHCMPVPAVVNRAGNLLYLFHPLFLTILISNGVDHAISAWVGACILSLVVSAIITYSPKALGVVRARNSS